jgi:hypothetical protein
MFKSIIRSRLSFYVTGLLSFFFALAVNGQAMQVYDIGVIPGELEKYQGHFRWVNPTDDSLVLDLSTDNDRLSFPLNSLEIAPNQEINLSYEVDLVGLTGKYNGNFKMVSNEMILEENLISAQVLPAVKDVFKAYRNVFFPFSTKEQLLNFKNGFRNDTLSAELFLFNFGGKEIDLSGVIQQENLTLSFYPEIVAHNGFTKMSATLITDSEVNLGYTKKVIAVNKGADSLIFSIPVQFTLESKPGNAVEDSPSIGLSLYEHNFRSVEVNETESVEITLSNSGVGNLQIEKIESNCDCLTYKLNQASLTSGESTMLKVQFDAKNRAGFERKTLAIFSNDPRRPTVIIAFIAQIKQ